jgi:hypothetical protein
MYQPIWKRSNDPIRINLHVNKGIALRVLTQKHGGQHQCVAFLSKFLDPEHIQAVAAAFGGDLIISTPHQVRTILNQKVGRWLMDSRILSGN